MPAMAFLFGRPIASVKRRTPSQFFLRKIKILWTAILDHRAHV